MLIVVTLYVVLIYLIFGKFKLLPLTGFWKLVIAIIGLVIVNIFAVGLGTLTPSSQQAIISGYITEIAPEVSGRVVSVPVRPNEDLLPGDTLFQIDPRPYQYRVDQLTANLAETESYVAGLKESYDAAREQARSAAAQLELTELRLRQQQQLVAAGAGTRFQLEQYQTQAEQQRAQLNAARANENQAYITLNAAVGDEQARVAQVLAQLESAQFDLENTSVLAPAAGVATKTALRPGMVVSPTRSVMTFVYTDTLMIGALFPQKALEHVRVGQTAKVNFPALPGRIFESKVAAIPTAVGEAQFFATGQIHRMADQRMLRIYPVGLTLPEDFPPDLRRLGLAASVRVHTDGAGVVGMVALVIQWIQTSLDYVL